MATSSFPALGNDEEGAEDARLGPWPKQRLVDSGSRRSVNTGREDGKRSAFGSPRGP
jgi:hypothetical protein